MKILELFAGYGSQALALKRLGLEFTAETSEIDKYAMQTYDMIHGKTNHHGDITKINEKELGYFDLITYSSPCQDFSTAGKQKGGDKGSETRSSLLWECERIIAEVKPKYLLMENVKNLVGKRHKHNFDAWLEVLEKLGYDNYWQVLNAKDYGVPQNRERVFVVSIRKDLNQGYKFPEKIPLEKRLKDILEPIVDEKFYLSDEQVARFQASNYNVTATRLQEKEWCDTLCARDYKDPKCVVEPKINMLGLLDIKGNEQARRVYDKKGLSPTLNTMQGGNRQPKIYNNYRIRKLTPRECRRLMGVNDVDFDKIQGISNSQLYKMAGNPIVVDVLATIFNNLLKETNQKDYPKEIQLNLF